MHLNLRKGLVTLAAAAVAATGGIAVSAAPAMANDYTHIYPKYDTRGPGLKNWHCIDTAKSPDWWGPWRYTKAGAHLDCASYIAGGNA